MTITKTMRWIGVLAVTAGLSASPALAGAHTAHKRHHHHHHNTIPQHNGGDHDADNRGGPSDGDGNI
ncbi:MAG TPA: hypothetical protein VHR88_10515 [Solirubrobacteraceae bacterium]|jgi:hypothetical protein|nr:hypothetical protein [Solirubrobacteraceae bacterium]